MKYTLRTVLIASAFISFGNALKAQTTLALWGMTKEGGTHTSTVGGYTEGTIFQYIPANNTFTKKFDFDGVNGFFPYGSLVEYNNEYYGMTIAGGAVGGSETLGVLFKYTPATNTFTKLMDFTMASGFGPYGSMIVYNNKLYGMTHNGGANPGTGGTLFEFDPATNTYTVKVNLGGNSGLDGEGPSGDLLLINNKLYGMTSGGGSNFSGVIFEYNPATNIYNKKADFSTSTGANPMGSLIWYNGKFYGLTANGGSGFGTIFEYDTASFTITPKYTFSTDGSAPQGDLTIVGNKFYGLAPNGGTNSDGVIFEYDPATSTYTKQYDFAEATSGHAPYGTMVESSGVLYGMTSGFSSTSSKGTIFSYTPLTGVVTKLHDFDVTNGSMPMNTKLLLATAPLSVPTFSSTNPIADVYPNPANDILTIDIYQTDAATFVLTDITGKVLKTAAVTKNSGHVDISNMAAGLYIYQLTDNKGTVIKTGKVNKH